MVIIETESVMLQGVLKASHNANLRSFLQHSVSSPSKFKTMVLFVFKPTLTLCCNRYIETHRYFTIYLFHKYFKEGVFVGFEFVLKC